MSAVLHNFIGGKWVEAIPNNNPSDTGDDEIFARKDELGRLLSLEEGKALASVRPGMGIEVTREALGIVGLVTPCSFPIVIPACEIAPALAHGNCVVYPYLNLLETRP